MPTPTIPDGKLFFNALTYAGSASNQTISGLNFQPDFIWFKERTTNGIDHNLFDSARSSYGSRLISNATNDEAASSAIVSVSSTGYTLLGGVSNTNDSSGRTYVTWNWKANGAAVTNTAGTISSQVSSNPTSGFSVVTYSANGSTGTVGHGLTVGGVAAIPSMIIVKKRNVAERWCVFHTSTSNAYIYLNEVFAAETINANIRFGNNTVVVQPTNSVFTIGSSNDVNGTSGTYVAYCWAAVPGYSAFGSYTANGVVDGPFVYLGFRPRFVLTKKTGTSGWGMVDTSINPYNQATTYLQANTSNAVVGGTSSNGMDMLSNGFKIRSSDASFNETNGDTYIYMAFAENPFKYANAR
jgi:hypothetical protein